MSNKVALFLLLLSFKSSFAIDFPEMVFIEPIPFSLGDNKYREVASHYDKNGELKYLLEEVNAALDNYSISKYEISISQFKEFCEITSYIPSYQKDKGSEFDFWGLFEGREDYPMYYVSHMDALYYCQWLSKVSGDRYRLPSDAEWEFAAMGYEDKLYPWGDDFRQIISKDFQRKDFVEWIHLPFDSVPIDTTVYGVKGMASGGELTMDIFGYSNKSDEVWKNPLRTFGRSPSRKGSVYSLYEETLGLLFRDQGIFNQGSPSSTFRIVREEEKTFFNRDTIEESIYYPFYGIVIKDDTPVYESSSMLSNKAFSIDHNTEVYAILMSQQEDVTKRYAQVFLLKEKVILGKSYMSGYFGWIRLSDIELQKPYWD